MKNKQKNKQTNTLNKQFINNKQTTITKATQAPPTQPPNKVAWRLSLAAEVQELLKLPGIDFAVQVTVQQTCGGGGFEVWNLGWEKQNADEKKNKKETKANHPVFSPEGI